jgi:hypothetical protein
MDRQAVIQPPRNPKVILSREADLIGRLYRAYRSDRDFLKTVPNARILVFLDSHEVKAFIDPDAPGSLAGFIMHLEELVGGANRRITVGLRHDQILNGLLFDPLHPSGILPSHGEEMDREVAFRFDKWFDTVLLLVKQAREEIDKHREQARRLAQATKVLDRADMQTDLVRFFQTHAPALTAILRDNLASSHMRLEAVLNDSQLTLFEDLPWREFEVGPADDVALRALRPSLGSIRQIRADLRVFDYRQNSIEANLIDAAALAHVSLLRTELARRDIRHIRVVLVSRAQTLLRAARDMARQTGDPLLVRHPRLLAITSPDAGKLDDAEELTLGTALGVWRSHLAGLPDEITDHSSLKEAGSAFLGAWDTFESSRLAIEVKWRENVSGPPGSSDDRQLAQQLIRLFCSNENAEQILHETLIAKFTEFGSTSSRYLLEKSQLGLKARLIGVASSERVYVTPVVVGAAGPIQVTRWAHLKMEDADLTLDEVANSVRGASERPLVWSLALACAGRWRQAAIFARGALQLAELERSQQTADEARLLRAEIRRLGARAAIHPDDDLKEPADRYKFSMRELESVTVGNSARRLREEAAQVLEAALAGVAIVDLPRRLQELCRELDKSGGAAGEDEAKARFFALMLMLHLYDARRRSGDPAMTPDLRERATIRHRELVDILRRLQDRSQTDALPHRARAMEVIGYVLFGGVTAPQLDPYTNGTRARPRPGNVPQALRGDMLDLLKGLSASSDEIGKFLEEELTAIWEALRPFHNPQLSLAPVALPQAFVNEMKRDHPDVLSQAWPAFARIDRIGAALLDGGPDPSHDSEVEAAISDLEQAVKLAQKAKLDRRRMFYLRTALLYARLLDATLEPQHLRRQMFDRLIAAYEALGQEYPTAALPYLRLHYVADEAGQDEIAQSALQRALNLVDEDNYYPNEAAGAPHWLQSFIRRRVAFFIMRQCPEANQKWQSNRGPAEEIQEVQVLREACRMLLDAERRDASHVVDGDEDRAHQLERERRTNNIVFCGGRLIERQGGRAAFDQLMPPQPLSQLIKRLIPNGIEQASNLDALHSVGSYFAAAGEISEAYGVAKRMFELMISGTQMTSENAEACSQEALSWFIAGQRQLDSNG